MVERCNDTKSNDCHHRFENTGGNIMTEQNKAIQERLSKIISEEAAKEVANLSGKELLEAFELLDEQMHFEGSHDEPATIKQLLDYISDIVMDISEVEEGRVYPVVYGTREGTETALERAKDLAFIILESYLTPLYGILGIGDE